MKLKGKRVRIGKLAELEEARHKNNIGVGDFYEGVALWDIEVGFVAEVRQDNGRIFHTSIVKEIQPNNCLKTYNSIYQVTVLE